MSDKEREEILKNYQKIAEWHEPPRILGKDVSFNNTPADKDAALEMEIAARAEVFCTVDMAKDLAHRPNKASEGSKLNMSADDQREGLRSTYREICEVSGSICGDGNYGYIFNGEPDDMQAFVESELAAYKKVFRTVEEGVVQDDSWPPHAVLIRKTERYFGSYCAPCMGRPCGWTDWAGSALRKVTQHNEEKHTTHTKPARAQNST